MIASALIKCLTEIERKAAEYVQSSDPAFNNTLNQFIMEHGAAEIFFIEFIWKGNCPYANYFNNLTGERIIELVQEMNPAYRNCLNLREAFKVDLVDAEKYYQWRFKEARQNIIDNSNETFNKVPFSKVLVNGGRKWKGEGILLNVDVEKYYYGHSYSSRYYGSRANYSTQRKARVYDPKTNRIYTVNADFMHNLDTDNIVKNVIQEFDKFIDSFITPKYVNCEETADYLLTKFTNPNEATRGWIETHKFDLSNIPDDGQEKENAKQQAFKDGKMADLINWVTTKGYKNTEEEIRAEAERIFKKRYGNY